MIPAKRPFQIEAGASIWFPLGLNRGNGMSKPDADAATDREDSTMPTPKRAAG